MLSKNAIYLLEQRYCRGGESPEGVLKRVSNFLAEGDFKFEDSLFTLMSTGVFFPNSPCIFNAGYDKGNLHACFCIPIEDSMDSICDTEKYMAKIFQVGGGAGINFSNLREEGAKLSRGGFSSGAISFMRGFDLKTEIIVQGGYRRGALMGLLEPWHPEIYKFETAKLSGKLQNFNISILVTDDFMQKVETEEKIEIKSPLGYNVGYVKAKDIFDLACFGAWVNGDPAFVFHDRINKDNPMYPGVDIRCTNPCSESALPDFGACCLGSINLAKFVWKNEFNFNRFAEVCRIGMRTLIAMNRLTQYPLFQIKEVMERFDPIGLGVMGFADCLIKLGIHYDSKECLDFIDQLGAVYKEATDNYDKDVFHLYRRIIAPTGSLSILSDCSSGIEPVYDVAFERSLTIGKIEEVRDLYTSKYVRTAHEVSPEWHVKVLAKWQEWINGGVSKTVNLPNNCSIEDVKNVYLSAWKQGCKGVTVYRDGCRTQVLKSVSSTNKFNLDKESHGKCSDSSCTL